MQSEDDGGGNIIQGNTVVEVKVTGPQDGNCGQVPSGATLYLAWTEEGTSAGRSSTTASGPTYVPGILPKEGGIGGITSRGL